MPITYDKLTKQYYDEKGILPLRKVIDIVDKVALKTKKEMKSVAMKLTSNKINRAEFEIQMSELLKQAHILVSGIAKGGRLQMTARDWGKVGNNLKTQYGFLNGFERKIANNKLSDQQIIYRAQLYSASVRIAFFTTLQEEKKGENEPKVRRVLNAAESCGDCINYANMGFVALSEMPEIGDSECSYFCKCEIEFES